MNGYSQSIAAMIVVCAGWMSYYFGKASAEAKIEPVCIESKTQWTEIEYCNVDQCLETVQGDMAEELCDDFRDYYETESYYR